MNSSSDSKTPSHDNAFIVADVSTESAEAAAAPRTKRTAGKWLLLLFVWSIGLIIWTLYIALLIAIGAYLS